MATTAPPTLSEIQRRLSSSGRQQTYASMPSSQQAQTAPVIDESEDVQDQRSGHLSGSGLETADEEPEADYDRSDEYEREDRMDDLYTATAIKSGYLHKKGERRRAWQKRFFVLRPRMLGYYKDSKEYKLLRQIPLSDIRTCAMVEIKKHDYVFGIVTKERTFYVQASSNHERDEWVQEINAAIKQAALIERATASEENDLSTPQPRESPALPGTADTSSTQQQQQQQPPPMMLPEQQQQQARSSLSGPINIVPQAQSRSHRAPQRSFSGMSAGSSSISPGPFSPAGANELSSSYTSQDPVEDIGDNFRQYSLQQANTGDYHSQTAYFGPSPANRSPALQQQMPRSASPQQQHQGVTSSSEDDDDEPPLTPLSGSFQETDTYAAFSNASPSALPPTRPRPVATSTPVTTATAASLAAVTGTSSSASPATSRLRELHGPPSAARHPDPNRTIMTGYLTKQGKRKNWRKRWFSLSSTCLSYSRSHMDNKVHHQIPLSRVLDVMEYEPPTSAPRRGSRTNAEPSSIESKSSQWQHCFQIITPKRTLRLCATDEQSEKQWISAIQTLLQVSRQNASSTTHSAMPRSTSQQQQPQSQTQAQAQQQKPPQPQPQPSQQQQQHQQTAPSTPGPTTVQQQAQQALQQSPVRDLSQPQSASQQAASTEAIRQMSPSKNLPALQTKQLPNESAVKSPASPLSDSPTARSHQRGPSGQSQFSLASPQASTAGRISFSQQQQQQQQPQHSQQTHGRQRSATQLGRDAIESVAERYRQAIHPHSQQQSG